MGKLANKDLSTLLNNLNSIYVVVKREDKNETMDNSIVYVELERNIKECISWLSLYHSFINNKETDLVNFKSTWIYHTAPPLDGENKMKYVKAVISTLIKESGFLLEDLEQSIQPRSQKLILSNLWTSIYRLLMVFN